MVTKRVFQLSMRCFEGRNFGLDALANRIIGTRFSAIAAEDALVAAETATLRAAGAGAAVRGRAPDLARDLFTTVKLF